MNLKVTPIASLKKYADMKEIVALPGWEEDAPFHCALRRSSLRGMITAGKIPNPLMAAAQRLYEGNSSKVSAKLEDTLKTMRIVVEDAMISPTLNDLEKMGLDLTEEQFAAIYLYAQNGAKALESFRKKPGNPDADSSGKDMANAAQ